MEQECQLWRRNQSGGQTSFHGATKAPYAGLWMRQCRTIVFAWSSPASTAITVRVLVGIKDVDVHAMQDSTPPRARRQWAVGCAIRCWRQSLGDLFAGRRRRRAPILVCYRRGGARYLEAARRYRLVKRRPSRSGGVPPDTQAIPLGVFRPTGEAVFRVAKVAHGMDNHHTAVLW